MKPTPDQARAFAIMLRSGVPASDAIRYFTDSADPSEMAGLLKDWVTSKAVSNAMRMLEGAAWEELSLEQKCARARDMHYAGLAYYLYRTHYAEVGPTDQAKLDKARAAVDAFLAGRAGAEDPLTEFFNDLRSGRIKTIEASPRVPKLGQA